MTDHDRGITGYHKQKAEHLKRLRRIEGQIRGLQRMVDEDVYCIDILTQVPPPRRPSSPSRSSSSRNTCATASRTRPSRAARRSTRRSRRPRRRSAACCAHDTSTGGHRSAHVKRAYSPVPLPRVRSSATFSTSSMLSRLSRSSWGGRGRDDQVAAQLDLGEGHVVLNCRTADRSHVHHLFLPSLTS